MCWHRWGSWQDAKVEWQVIKRGDVTMNHPTVAMQQRRCMKCNEVESKWCY